MKSRQSACRDLRTDMVNTFDGSPISAFAYAYDAAGRRTERVDSGLTTNLFGYNMRSELADAIMGTNAYAYDPIGNRQWASANENTNLYQANELNQYTNINEGAVEPVYDADGNMTLFGLWTYAWDAENRLISVSSNGVPVVQNQYDYMSRRVMKATATQTNTFLYDGWNLVREDLGAATPSSRSYVWGLDLSGTLQGAGGVGGLLAILSPDSCLLTPAYDANGNITDLVDTNGTVVAHYEYDPYGNIITQSGDQADANPFRYSSKYWDGETGFYYYGYRFYSPGLGSWLSKDPIGEIGGINLYSFSVNNPVNIYDPLGLSNCEDLKKRIEAWDFYKELKNRKNSSGQPCVGEVKCAKCHPAFAASYSPSDGSITVYETYYKNGKYIQNSIDDMEESIRHELSHADSQCRTKYNTCDECMIEEKKAYFRSGGCTDNYSCTKKAWGSCRYFGGCVGKALSPHHFKIGDPTNLSPIPPVPK